MARKKSATIFARATPELAKAFDDAVVRENEMLGNFDGRNTSDVLRELCADYVKRIEAIAQSEVAQQAARTLRKAHRAVRRA